MSECTKRDIVKFYGISPEKIDVVYQGCDPVFARPVSKKEKDRVRAAYGLPERFILSVGTIEERKNLLLAVKAVEKLDDVHLVAIGKSTDYAKKVQDYVEAHGLENRVHIIHNLKFRRFADIVSSGLAVCISFSFRGVRNSHCRSSFRQGFRLSLPPVPVWKKPAANTRFTSIPTMWKVWRMPMKKVLADEHLRREMIEKGKEYVVRFDPKTLADEMNAVYLKCFDDKTFTEDRFVQTSSNKRTKISHYLPFF